MAPEASEASEVSLPPNLYNCAAEICCSPLAAARARRSILGMLGCPDDCVDAMAEAMQKLGVAFAPASLMREIATLADHPGRGGAA